MLVSAAYRAQQMGMLLNCLVGHRVLRAVARKQIEPSPAALREVRERYRDLIERDLDNVRAGLYPRSLLFQFPFKDYISKAPQIALDLPRTLRRMRARDYRDFPNGVDVRRYPPYFRRNFHWQTDGYFSRRSAEIYDVGVEFLFLGTADVMRRQVIPPVSRFVRENVQEDAQHSPTANGAGPGGVAAAGGRGPRTSPDLRVLDVACGTGRTIHQLAIAHPKLRYYGLDLSPYYLQVAREVLANVEHLSLLAENAEHVPFKDDYFDVVTSVYLFHELPRNARRNVYREMLRVLRPGGLLVIEDSGQVADSGEVAWFLGQFSKEFHEPFHRDYLQDDIAAALEEVGFEVRSSEPCFVAKVVEARKPA